MDYDKDSLIVACSKENFQNIFLKEQAWYPIPIAKNKVCLLKYLFAYQKFPIGAITYLAEIERIEFIDSLKKYKVIFKGAPKKISPIKMGEDQRNVPQNPRYCNSEKVLQAQTMDSIY